MRAYVNALRTSIVNNATAYGYSVAITASFGVVSTIRGNASVLQVFLFAAGAVTAFSSIDAIASGGFHSRMRGDPPEVIVLGSALSFLSVGGSVGMAALIAETVDSGVAWVLSAFLATVAYIAIVAVELAIAERIDPQDVRDDG